MAWTPGSWCRANAIKTKSVEKARIENETASLIASEETIGYKKEYWVQIYGAEYYVYTFTDKNEANAKWVELKRKYF